MTINVTTSIGFQDLADIFGLPAPLIATLNKYCVLQVMPKNIVVEGLSGKVLATANIKAGVLSQAKKNKLGPATKAMMKNELEKAFEKAVDKLPSVAKKPPKYLPVDDPEVKKAVLTLMVLGSDKVAAIKKFRALTGTGLKEAKDLVDGWWDEAQEVGVVADPDLVAPAKPKKKVKKKYGSHTFTKKPAEVKIKEGVMLKQAVRLIDATEVLQPVHGSNDDSVYFAVALGPQVNIGCRVRADGYTSIRAEGPALQDVTDNLADAGLTGAGDKHWSLHMQIDNKKLIKKAIGAVLYAMSLPFTKVAGDVTPIMGKGV